VNLVKKLKRQPKRHCRKSENKEWKNGMVEYWNILNKFGRYSNGIQKALSVHDRALLVFG
jgi:hypothetical protein